jgi:hypothetical protein
MSKTAIILFYYLRNFEAEDKSLISFSSVLYHLKVGFSLAQQLFANLYGSRLIIQINPKYNFIFDKELK